MLAGSAPSSGNGGGGITFATRPSCSRRRADVEVGAERSRDFVREERADRRARDPAHDLTDEIALRDRVIAGRRARLPPRLLRGQQRGRLVPVVQVVGLHRLLPARQSRAVTQEMANLDALLAILLELGPVASDGRVQVELASVREHERAQRSHGLRRRPDVDDRVLLPRLCARLVDMPAPDVDHEVAVVHDRHTGADVGPGVDVRRQHVVHGLVTRRHGPLYLCHVVPLSATAIVARTCWTWQVDVSSLFTELFGRIPPLARAAVDTTDVAVLTRSPEPGANTIAWLVWHLARVQDHHVAELLDTDQIWVGGDWAERFGLDARPVEHRLRPLGRRDG